MTENTQQLTGKQWNIETGRPEDFRVEENNARAHEMAQVHTARVVEMARKITQADADGDYDGDEEKLALAWVLVDMVAVDPEYGDDG